MNIYAHFRAETSRTWALQDEFDDGSDAEGGQREQGRGGDP